MKRILAAVDGTGISSLVVTRAIEIATVTGGKLRLYRAVTPQPSQPPPGIFVPPYTDSLVAAATASLRALLEGVPSALRDGVVVELGMPASGVCDAAKTYDADLVVIGAHRYGVLSRVLGTTAASIVNGLDRPVFVVRPVPHSTDADDATKHRAGDRLRRDHTRLEKMYEDLLASYQSCDWSDVRGRWDAFDAGLRAHMELEETRVLPAFRAVDRDEAAAILAEHDQLRQTLDTLGLQVDLHALPQDVAAALIDQLRIHARREEKLLYPWMNRTGAPAPVDGKKNALHSTAE